VLLLLLLLLLQLQDERTSCTQHEGLVLQMPFFNQSDAGSSVHHLCLC
jgi:hypothetical protein